jgi:hypothetical protein
MAVFVAVLIMVGTLGAYLGTRGIRAATTPSAPGGLRRQLVLATQVRDFRMPAWRVAQSRSSSTP